MTIQLPPACEFLRPAYHALLARAHPVDIPPGCGWSTIPWDRVETDPWSGYSAARPTGWAAPIGGMYQVCVSGLEACSAESFAFESATIVDGVVDEGVAFVRLLRGGDPAGGLDPSRRPVVHHAFTYGALVYLEQGQACGLVSRHSLPGVLRVGSGERGLGWLVQRAA